MLAHRKVELLALPFFICAIYCFDHVHILFEVFIYQY
ncbi:hypothetical protein AF77_00240 [Aliarcobacter butzleri L352]|uniref:Uncharacterized protein n=1 Tax=Aliarcobacter butzleri L352 TaxID=1447260 RepID=A0A837JDU1_9BACT|nr:hypothetical protein AF77_00240 [Aliarcobacter butzleri L352]